MLTKYLQNDVLSQNIIKFSISRFRLPVNRKKTVFIIELGLYHYMDAILVKKTRFSFNIIYAIALGIRY